MKRDFSEMLPITIQLNVPLNLNEIKDDKHFLNILRDHLQIYGLFLPAAAAAIFHVTMPLFAKYSRKFLLAFRLKSASENTPLGGLDHHYPCIPKRKDTVPYVATRKTEG